MSLASWAGSRGRFGRFTGMVRVCREGGLDARGARALPYSKEPTTNRGRRLPRRHTKRTLVNSVAELKVAKPGSVKITETSDGCSH